MLGNTKISFFQDQLKELKGDKEVIEYLISHIQSKNSET